MPVEWLILILSLAWLGYLFAEAKRSRKAREVLEHVIHVNGTRGKTTVCRLIDAGLRAGGYRVFCKTTGTDPMICDTQGQEEPLKRRGKANIKEQLNILNRAAGEGARVLVIECMAIQPELQNVSQNNILFADIGVITNVRRDHTDVMGSTLPQIGEALSNTIPKNGILFTAEDTMSEALHAKATAQSSEFVQVRPDGSEPDFDFAENIALALAVCQHLGVKRETALKGMRHYRPDPYALSVHRWADALFVGGLSINDVQSICMIWEELANRYDWGKKELILLINNRRDRGSRTVDMLSVCKRLQPEQVWLMGASRGFMRLALRRMLPGIKVTEWKSSVDIRAAELRENRVIFAVGNIAGCGRELMARVREEGEFYVQ